MRDPLVCENTCNRQTKRLSIYRHGCTGAEIDVPQVLSPGPGMWMLLDQYPANLGGSAANERCSAVEKQGGSTCCVHQECGYPSMVATVPPLVKYTAVHVRLNPQQMVKLTQKALGCQCPQFEHSLLALTQCAGKSRNWDCGGSSYKCHGDDSRWRADRSLNIARTSRTCRRSRWEVSSQAKVDPTMSPSSHDSPRVGH